jgi:hypothetical protein
MPERYRVLLVDVGADTPAAVRLRAALKRLLRTYRLRCLEAVELAEDAAADPWAEVARLQNIVEGLAERVSRQSGLLSRRAEKGG